MIFCSTSDCDDNNFKVGQSSNRSWCLQSTQKKNPSTEKPVDEGHMRYVRGSVIYIFPTHVRIRTRHTPGTNQNQYELVRSKHGRAMVYKSIKGRPRLDEARSR